MHHRCMRSRARLRPAVAFDLALGAAFGLVALAAFLASGRPRAALATAHSVASQVGWREGYEIGLIVGLVVVAILAITIAGLVTLVRRRA